MACIMGVSTSMKRRSWKTEQWSTCAHLHRWVTLTISDEANHSASLPESLTRPVVPQQVEVPHTGSLLSIRKGELDTWEHVKTRAEEGDLGRKDGELARLLVLRVRPAGVARDTNDIAAAQVDVLVLERD